MFCTNCGSKLADNQKFCTVCGKPLSVSPPRIIDAPNLPVTTYQNNGAAPLYQQPLPFQQQINIQVPQRSAEYKTKWETPRVIIGIITIILFFLFQFQSCVAAGGEVLQSIFSDEVGTSGMTGYVTSFFFLIAGIVSIVCRKSRGGTIAAGIIYAICGLVTVNEDFSYFQDLVFYCFLSFVFAGIMIIGGALQKSRAGAGDH
jgi:ABC-type multidrug transport system permease subunit